MIINTTIYNCALDNVLTGTKMLVEGEKKEDEDGEDYLIKGNSPTRDDIFRYKVKLKNARYARNPRTGEKVFVDEHFVPTFKFSKDFKSSVDRGMKEKNKQ